MLDMRQVEAGKKQSSHLSASFSLLSSNSCTVCSSSTVMHKFYSLNERIDVVLAECCMFLGLLLHYGLAVLRVVQKWLKLLLFVLVRFFLHPFKFSYSNTKSILVM